MTQPLHIEQLTGAVSPICVDCGQTFGRAPGEEAARRGSGLPLSPRCPDCRARQRDAHNAEVQEHLERGALRSEQPLAPGPDDGGERVHSAVCSGCQRPIRLPFRPRLDRPVFCRFCHDQRQGR